MRMVAQYEVRNFLISRLVTEIALNYYELMALDNVSEDTGCKTLASRKRLSLKCRP